jgi:hypothetical protein
MWKDMCSQLNFQFILTSAFQPPEEQYGEDWTQADQRFLAGQGGWFSMSSASPMDTPGGLCAVLKEDSEISSMELVMGTCQTLSGHMEGPEVHRPPTVIPTIPAMQMISYAEVAADASPQYLQPACFVYVRRGSVCHPVCLLPWAI